MKFIVVSLLFITLSGCATAPRLSCDETCALEGMYCKGQTLSTATSTTLGPQNTIYSGDTSTKSYVCEKNDAKTAEVKRFRDQAEAKQKVEYVEDAKDKACRGPQRTWPAFCWD